MIRDGDIDRSQSTLRSRRIQAYNGTTTIIRIFRTLLLYKYHSCYSHFLCTAFNHRSGIGCHGNVRKHNSRTVTNRSGSRRNGAVGRRYFANVQRSVGGGGVHVFIIGIHKSHRSNLNIHLLRATRNVHCINTACIGFCVEQLSRIPCSAIEYLYDNLSAGSRLVTGKHSTVGICLVTRIVEYTT